MSSHVDPQHLYRPARPAGSWRRLGPPIDAGRRLTSLVLDPHGEPAVATIDHPGPSSGARISRWHGGRWDVLPPLPVTPNYEPCLATSAGGLYVSVMTGASGQGYPVRVFKWDEAGGRWVDTDSAGNGTFAPCSTIVEDILYGGQPVLAPNGSGGLLLAYITPYHGALFPGSDDSPTYDTNLVAVYEYRGEPGSWVSHGLFGPGSESAPCGQPTIVTNGPFGSFTVAGISEVMAAEIDWQGQLVERRVPESALFSAEAGAYAHQWAPYYAPTNDPLHDPLGTHFRPVSQPVLARRHRLGTPGELVCLCRRANNEPFVLLEPVTVPGQMPATLKWHHMAYVVGEPGSTADLTWSRSPGAYGSWVPTVAYTTGSSAGVRVCEVGWWEGASWTRSQVPSRTGRSQFATPFSAATQKRPIPDVFSDSPTRAPQIPVPVDGDAWHPKIAADGYGNVTVAWTDRPAADRYQPWYLPSSTKVIVCQLETAPTWWSKNLLPQPPSLQEDGAGT